MSRDKIHDELNSEFKVRLKDFMSRTHDMEVETRLNIFTGGLMTTRVDGEDFTPVEVRDIAVFENAYLEACSVVSEQPIRQNPVPTLEELEELAEQQGDHSE